MIVEALRSILMADASVFAIVGDRIYPDELPDAPTYPAVVISRVAGPSEYDMQGDIGLEAARVQVDCHHDGGASACIALKRAVKSKLSGFSGSADSGEPCQIQGTFCINDFTLREPATERAGPRVRRRTLEFMVWTREV